MEEKTANMTISNAAAKKFQSLYRNCSESFLSVVDARLRQSCPLSQTKEAVIITKQKQNAKFYYSVITGTETGDAATHWTAAHNYAAFTLSPCGQYSAYLYDADISTALCKTDEPDVPKIQVWDKASLGIAVTIDIHAKAHGPFWGGASSCAFTHSGDKLLYMAEASWPPPPTQEATPNGNNTLNLRKFDLQETWGEEYIQKGCSRLFVAHLKEANVTAVAPLSDQHSYLNPCWLLDEESFVCSAFDTSLSKLGLYACNNRPSRIFLATPTHKETSNPTEYAKDKTPIPLITFDWIPLSQDTDYAAWNPIIVEQTHTTAKILYLQLEKDTPNILPHSGECTLKVVHITRTDPQHPWEITQHYAIQYTHETIPPHTSSGLPPHTFSGLYSLRIGNWSQTPFLFANTFIGPTVTVVKICYSASKSNVYRIRLIDPLQWIPHYTEWDSLVLLDYKENRMLLKHSSPISTPQVLVAKVNHKDETKDTFPAEILGLFPLGRVDQKQGWSIFGRGQSIRNQKEWQLWDHRHIVLKNKAPPSNKPKPLVVSIHGGPHTCYSTEYNADMIFLSELGFDVLGVNYRGSVGFGQMELLSLLGNIGVQDVQDVKNTLSKFLETNKGHYDDKKLTVIGGSHGGFLVCHLIGQFPNLFCAASTRNPVTHIPSMAATSDIPDWCFAEAVNKHFNFAKMYDAEDVKKMLLASPIQYVENVQTPLLLGVGSIDLRVPASQSLHYYKLLKAMGKIGRLLYFPENNHSLPNAYCAEHYWLNTAVWFTQYIAG